MDLQRASNRSTDSQRAPDGFRQHRRLGISCSSSALALVLAVRWPVPSSRLPTRSRRFFLIRRQRLAATLGDLAIGGCSDRVGLSAEVRFTAQARAVLLLFGVPIPFRTRGPGGRA